VRIENSISTRTAAAFSKTLPDFPVNNGQLVIQIQKSVCVCVHSAQMRERLHIMSKSMSKSIL
jgi:hypothetical protein